MAESSSKIDKGKARDPDAQPATDPDFGWENVPFDPDARTPADPQADLSISIPPAPTDDKATVVTRNANRPAESTTTHHLPVGTGVPGSMPALRGKKLAHFELIAPIGVGGMAAVIKAQDTQLERIVALKILPPDMATDPENVHRFHQEARAAAKLDHENIARVFFCGEDQALHFIAFEFVQGENLRTLLERRGRLPVGEALHYMLQVATGLAHASSRGVVHRDIKPSNIIITPTGRAKLVDMGLARSMAPQDDKGLTHSGVTLGTFDYISPEQALEPREADVRSDIYSLGCTFYHMLTGQPPVPEGTAAKKLNHHQHEQPIDPRQLNPDVPDEVAAILGRMMAKKPADRYQRPEHLVQHLLRVAQKLESGVEAPDGLLYVDAPLPSPPSARPVLVAALAVAAVIALIFLADPKPTPRPRPGQPRLPAPVEKDAKKTPEDITPPIKAGPGDFKKEELPGVGSPRAYSFRYPQQGKARELRDFLANVPRDADAEVVLTDDLDLTAVSEDPTRPTLVFRGRSLIFQGEGTKLRTVRLSYNGRVIKTGNNPSTALLVDADKVEIRGIRFVLDAGAVRPMIAVHLRGGESHEVKNCQFFQHFPVYNQEQPVCSVLFENNKLSGPRPALAVTNCAFIGEEDIEEEKTISGFASRKIGRGGQHAITRRGPGDVKVTDCVFGPHTACFYLDGLSRPSTMDLVVRHCTAMLGDGSAVFHAAGGAGCRLQVDYCLFARPSSRGESEPSPSLSAASLLVRQDGPASVPGRPGGLQYHGTDNRYFALDGFWAREDTMSLANAKDFEARLQRDGGGSDAQSQVLESSPWTEAEPLTALQELRLVQGFRVKTGMSELRPTGVEDFLIGARECEGVSYTAGLPVLAEKKTPGGAGKEKFVDPSILVSDDGTFRTLLQAVEEANPGDEVLIKHNGPLSVKPITLEKANNDVTIRPAPNFHPVLVLDTTERNASLIRLHHGKVKLLQLEIRLSVPQREFDAQSVVTILGNGACAFEDCVITLEESPGASLAVAVLADPNSSMKKIGRDTANGPPAVTFTNCFVRGKGELVWCRSSRPFTLTATQTVVALSGSLLVMESGKGDDAGMPVEAPKTRSSVELTNVTAAINGHLIHLRGKDLKALVPVDCKSTSCLFAALADRSLVHLSGMEATEAALKEALSWTGSNNAYSFMELVDQQPGGAEMMRPKPITREQWKTFTGEGDGKFVDAVKFPEMLEMATLSRSLPTQFAVTDLKDHGADPRNLPKPHRDDSPE